MTSWFLRLCERLSKLPVRNPVGATTVLKHWQQLLIRAIFTSTNELGGEKNSPAIPGLRYIGSNHNLSHSRRRSLEHLRGVRDKNEPRLQLLEEKKNGHQREADLRLINCRHERVQGDDDESIWKNRRTKTTWLKMFWLTLSTSVGGASSTITSQYNHGYSKHLLCAEGRLHLYLFNYC